jgi:hypothetical protein
MGRSLEHLNLFTDDADREQFLLLLNTKTVLKRFGEKVRDARANYRRYLQEGFRGDDGSDAR